MEEKVIGLENLVDLKDSQLAVLKVIVQQNKNENKISLILEWGGLLRWSKKRFEVGRAEYSP